MRCSLPLILLFGWAGAACAQPALTPAQAQALVGRALAAESRNAQDFGHPNHPMRYLLRKSSTHITSTKEIVETSHGDVARLIALNDRPLTAADEQREQARLDALLSNPRLQQHRMYYRVAGAQEWRQGYPLVYDARARSSIRQSPCN